MEGSGVLTLTPLIPKPLPSESFLQKNIPTYPASVFSEMPEGSRGKKDQRPPPLDSQALRDFQYGGDQGFLSLLSLHPHRGRESVLTFSKTPQSPLPEESAHTGDVRKQQKTPNSKQHRQQGQPCGSWGQKVPLNEPKTIGSRPRAAFSEKAHF